MREFIRDETHYALEQEGYVWNREKRCFTVVEEVGKIYPVTRDRVLHAFTNKAIDFFKSCPDNRYPTQRDLRNLRGTLKHYLARV